MRRYDYSRKPTPTPLSWEAIVPPSYQLITVDEARYHLRLEDYGGDDGAAEATYLTDLIATAGDAIETHTRRPIRDQRRALIIRREDFGDGDWGAWCRQDALVINATPIRSVDGISYREDGETRTIAPSGVRVRGTGEGISRNVEIYPLENERWPWQNRFDWDEDSDIRIEVTCGYTQPNLPAPMKHACKLMVNDWYAMRGGAMAGATPSEVPRSVSYLLSQFTREVFG